MKRILIAILVLLLSNLALAGDMAEQSHSGPVTVEGVVLKVIKFESYTYLKLKTSEGEKWAAVSKADVRKGDSVTIANAITLHNFKSKSLNRTFPVILFGDLGGSAGVMASIQDHAHLDQSGQASNVDVPKANGLDAYSVADIVGNAKKLQGKTVTVSGTVVKYNLGIMGRNWVHIRDGSGTESAQNNDILVTTSSRTKVGDIVTFKGIVNTDKDFGAGYSYNVLIEEATIQ